MSNEVYFNEPGYEHLMGTPQGEKLNNGYANIVRYGTLKYAIIEQLRNPAKGFEDVIRRNFFLKKDLVMNLVMHLEYFSGELPIPAILKPEPLWTGKQIMSLFLPKVDSSC